MPAILAFIIVAISVIAITYKTYMGYGEYSITAKIGFFLFLVLGWCAPFISFALRQNDPSGSLIILTKVGYCLFGFVFFLFVITFLRDTLWMLIDLIRRAPMDNMKNPLLLKKINIATIVVCVAVCIYGVYEAEKNAAIKTFEITSAKVKEPTKVVMLSDLHIDVDVSAEKIKSIVERVNALTPDAIVLVGDIIDNTPKNLYKQMEELKELKAKYGVYITLGNHEFYVGAQPWGMKFASMGLKFLNNFGEKLGNTGVYIAGIPDINAAKGYNMPVKIENALHNASEDDYVILLSHTPKILEDMNAKKIDMILSGHTHGGQIYPFHYFVEQANDGMLAGFYNRNGLNLYISRGTRYWGPPMRVFAPSEITVFNLAPQKDATVTK
ncbi:MAG: metallophosphoesterase [Acetobacter sp.]|nr:metallophosphoesterase [Acetobacter sp.]